MTKRVCETNDDERMTLKLRSLRLSDGIHRSFIHPVLNMTIFRLCIASHTTFELGRP